MQKYSPYFAEAIIPILGFYYWDWNWYFILLFFILDGLAKEIILQLKSKKIYATQGGETGLSAWRTSGLKSLLIGLVTLILLHFMYYINHENVAFLDEIIRFLSYKEMGLAQGWVLVPLIALNVWMQYKFTFLKLGHHTKITLSQLWKQHLHFRLFYLAVIVVGLGIHTVFHFGDVVFVWSSVVLPFVYERFMKPLN